MASLSKLRLLRKFQEADAELAFDEFSAQEHELQLGNRNTLAIKEMANEKPTNIRSGHSPSKRHHDTPNTSPGEITSPNKIRLGKAPQLKPKGNGHYRLPSVKMSLTPAQRVEKRPGLRSRNALRDFSLYEKIGRGAFADVFRGLNTRTGQIVAIKQISLDKDHSLNELMGEIDLLKILKHPHIVKYHGFVMSSHHLNVVLEFCGGGSLRDVYKNLGHGLAANQIISYTKPVLEGLAYLHDQGVVHRDVKAANVLLSSSGEVKLADFGVATKVATSHNTMVGTPNWMAPETILGGDGICTSSDVWSLGATLIELFTTHPPYHDLNPMATLHAIGTEEHPPLPSGLSPLFRDFLLECFQRQPSLRISAKLLLKHQWLLEGEYIHGKPTPTGGRAPATKEDCNPDAVVKRQFSRSALLKKFTEKNDETEYLNDVVLLNAELLKMQLENEVKDLSDPFIDLDIGSFDTNEIEIQSKMELLMAKLRARLSTLDQGHEGLSASLVKITGRLLHLVKKYPVLHDTFIRDHGILTLMDLLEHSLTDFVEQHKLWYHVLMTLNTIFEHHGAQLDNFALLGGIPMITQFSKLSYGLLVRLQVVKFVQHLKKSEKATLMFVSSGGIRVLSRFLEEDFDVNPEFPLVAISCYHEILSEDITRFKSDMCRILSRYGVVFWFAVLLNRLTKYANEQATAISHESAEDAIDKMLDIMKHFSQAEPQVRKNIATTDLIKLLVKVFPLLNFKRRIMILKFFRSLSSVKELLRLMYAADILEFYVGLLIRYNPSAEHYKEVINILMPSFYNCCYLNHSKELEVVKLGAVPLLRDLSKINLPFRQFVLPILCELVYCGEHARTMLARHDVFSVYLNLLVDPYWQSNALESIIHWSSEDPDGQLLAIGRALDCLVSGFMMNNVSNCEAVLDSYFLILSTNENVLKLFCKDSIMASIISKLSAYLRMPAAKLTLLRILQHIVDFAGLAGQTAMRFDTTAITPVLQTISENDNSVLVKNLAQAIAGKLRAYCI